MQLVAPTNPGTRPGFFVGKRQRIKPLSRSLFERGVESYALLSTEMIKLRHVRELNAAPAQSGFQPFRMG